MARGLLTSGFSCVLQMPTGSGKTWLAEQALGEVLQSGRRAVYLTPLRALAGELGERWRQRFAPACVGIFTGDHGGPGRPFPVPFDDARLLVMTPERLDACTRGWRAHWGWLPEVDLVVVDELHLLGDRHRGARLEGALSRLQRLNPFARLLGLSATLGNREELADWLGGTEHASDWRPVPLTWRVVRYRRATEKPQLLLAEVQPTLAAGGKSLVFVQSRRRAEELAGHLAAAGLRATHHHAGLGQEDRRTVEGGFRGGEIDVLVATATLEMGLNLPVRQVVLYDLQAFDGSDFSPLSVNCVWQRAGRAGRPGLDAAGQVVLLAAAWDGTAAHYAEGHFEPIRSGLRERQALAEQVVIETASGLARTPDQLARIFQGSLAARQGTLPEVQTLVAEMVEAGMLERDRTDRLRGTRLGHVACRHLLAPATVLLLGRVLEGPHERTFLDLLLTASASDDAEPVLPADFEELDDLAGRVGQEPSALLGRTRGELAELLGIDGKRLLAAVKMAVVARAWTRSGDVEAVAGDHGCYPFEVERLCDCLARLLLAMGALAPGSEQAEVPLRERIVVLRQMVLQGLDEEAATLTLIEGIGGTMAARLKRAGIGDVEALAQAEVADLAGVPGLSAGRAAKWIDRATQVVRSCSAYRYRELRGPARSTSVPPGWPGEVDPYRLRRALDLRIAGQDGGTYRVVGGLEPHLVRTHAARLVCDCPDAGQGHLCKHVLAVRLHRQDRELLGLVRNLSAQGEGALDLQALWFAGVRSSAFRR